MTMLRHNAVVVALCAGVVACGDATGVDVDEPTILFTGNGSAGLGLYITDASGTVVRPLTSQPAQQYYGAWSPDGLRIAYSRGFEPNIFVMNSDGTDVRQITDGQRASAYPAWSPDGTRIAYWNNDDPLDWGINIINVDGSNVRRVPNTLGAEPAPVSWSPDGRLLAFTVHEVVNGEFLLRVYVIHPDGSNRTRITEGSGSWPAWSPDGSRIAFAQIVTTALGTTRRIVTVASDGTDMRPLTAPTSGWDWHPRWSPDGRWIVFNRRDPSTTIHIVPADSGETSGLRTVVAGEYASWRPR